MFTRIDAGPRIWCCVLPDSRPRGFAAAFRAISARRSGDKASRRAPSTPGPREFLSGSEWSRLILARRPGREVHDHLRQLVRIAGSFWMRGHVLLHGMLVWMGYRDLFKMRHYRRNVHVEIAWPTPRISDRGLKTGDGANEDWTPMVCYRPEFENRPEGQSPWHRHP